MRLTKTEIKNFRSIKDCSISHKKITALVGKNNVGKSAILRALNSFFNYEDEREYFNNGVHQYSSASRTTRIELTFSNITNLEKYNEYMEDNELIIRMTYSKATKKRSIYYKKNNKYNNLRESFINDLNNDITFILIPIDRDNKEVIWNENSLLKLLLDEHFKQSTSKRDDLTPKVKELSLELERTGLKRIQNAIEDRYTLNKNFKFEFNFDDKLDYSILLDQINIEINEKNLKYNITESGSGIQSLTIIAMYRYLAELRYTNIMLGIEEPEINLHPQAQREFVKSMKENKNIESQIIFTTHSSTIVDQLEHEEIVLFRKVEDKTRGFKTQINQLPNDFFEKNNLKEQQYYKFYRYKNSDFFFSDFVVVVESSNDAEVVKALMRKQNIELNFSGITFIELGGVTSLNYPFYLLESLSIPRLIIVDKDFFLPYLNDKLDNSRDNVGLPKYRYEYKKANLKLIEQMIPNDKKRDKLLNFFRTDHSKALNLLEEFNLISMNYCLEMDLLSSKKSVEKFCDILSIETNNDIPNKKNLLLNYHNKIKKPFNMLKVIEELSNRNYSYSYKRIRSVLTSIVERA